MEQKDFDSLRKLVYENSGIYFDIKKKYFVEKRVITRVSLLNLDNIPDYIYFLKYKDTDKNELSILVNDLTTNETYFYREYPTLKIFAEKILPSFVAEQKKGNRRKSVKIWSAASSSGEEPYTLAIILKEFFLNIPNWNISILGTDINDSVLKKAKSAVYNSRSVKYLPDIYLEKYFKNSNNKFYLNNDIKKMVDFKKINLFDNDSMSTIRNYDLIFCRNVLIYFDIKSKIQVINSLHNSLVSGGYLLLGCGETIHKFSDVFKIKKVDGLVFYQK